MISIRTEFPLLCIEVKCVNADMSVFVTSRKSKSDLGNNDLTSAGQFYREREITHLHLCMKIKLRLSIIHAPSFGLAAFMQLAFLKSLSEIAWGGKTPKTFNAFVCGCTFSEISLNPSWWLCLLYFYFSHLKVINFLHPGTPFIASFDLSSNDWCTMKTELGVLRGYWCFVCFPFNLTETTATKKQTNFNCPLSDLCKFLYQLNNLLQSYNYENDANKWKIDDEFLENDFGFEVSKPTTTASVIECKTSL